MGVRALWLQVKQGHKGGCSSTLLGGSGDLKLGDTGGDGENWAGLPGPGERADSRRCSVHSGGRWLEFLDDSRAMAKMRRAGWGWLWSFGTGFI